MARQGVSRWDPSRLQKSFIACVLGLTGAERCSKRNDLEPEKVGKCSFRKSMGIHSLHEQKKGSGISCKLACCQISFLTWLSQTSFATHCPF